MSNNSRQILEHLEYVEKDLLKKIEKDKMFAILAANHGLQKMVEELIELGEAVDSMPDTAAVLRVKGLLGTIHPAAAITAVSMGVAINQIRGMRP